MASRTRLRVSARTSGSLLMTLDTVLDETCARSATSWMVTDAGMGVMESGQTSLRQLGAPLSYRVCRRRTRRARSLSVGQHLNLRNRHPELAGCLDGKRYIHLGEIRTRRGKAGHGNGEGRPCPDARGPESLRHVEHSAPLGPAQGIRAPHSEGHRACGRVIDPVMYLDELSFARAAPHIGSSTGNSEHTGLRSTPIGNDSGGCKRHAYGSMRTRLFGIWEMNFDAAVGEGQRPRRRRMRRMGKTAPRRLEGRRNARGLPKRRPGGGEGPRDKTPTHRRQTTRP